jgi:hypothetical protein
MSGRHATVTRDPGDGPPDVLDAAREAVRISERGREAVRRPPPIDLAATGQAGPPDSGQKAKDPETS